MPLKLNVGASKKVGEANYGSRGASVNLELELESHLVSEPGRLQQKIRQLFALVRTALTEELNGNGQHSEPPSNGNGSGKEAGNGNGNGEGSTKAAPSRPATQSQIKALHAIAKSKGLDLGGFLQDQFQVNRPDRLDIKEASQAIDQLKNGR